MAKAYQNMGEICDAVLNNDVDFLMLLNFITERDTAAYDRGYRAATELYTALLTTNK